MNDTLDALLALTLTPGLSSAPTRRLLEHYKNPCEAAGASPDVLARAAKIPLSRAQAAHLALNEILRSDKVKKERELVEQTGTRVMTFTDPDYPKLLALIDDAPPVLFIRGALAESDAMSIAMVGSRKCSTYGREQADRFASFLAQSGLTIVSGGALGVDSAAHRAAIRVKGRTLIVIGSGLANPYPRDNTALFDQVVAEGRGALLSELPMTAPPLKENFPRRNRIVSGLSLGVLVVEAPTRSGSLITARIASEEHGREVLAIPGPIDRDHSSGCHRMIREGWATLVATPADALESLGETGQLLQAGPFTPPGLFTNDERAATPAEASINSVQQQILASLQSPLHFDQLAAQTSLPVAKLQAELTMLQIRGLIKREQGRISRSR